MTNTMSTPPVPPVPAPYAPVCAQLAPLVAVRDAALFEKWWNESANQDEVAAQLATLTNDPDGLDVEWVLHSLMLDVVQSDPEGVDWLSLQGLNGDAEARWLTLDLDPSYDGDGKLDGIDVAMSVHIVLPGDRGLHFLCESVYVGHPRSVLVPKANDPREASAELVDQSLALVNDSLAERDELPTARQQISATSSPDNAGDAAAGVDAVINEKTIRDVVNAAADEVITVAELPATGARDALSLMANIVLHRLFSDRSASVDEIVDESYDVSLDEVLSWIDS
jgi:hypothetical protein